MKNSLCLISLAGFMMFFLAGCQKEKKVGRDYPQIRTLAVDQITPQGARFNAAIISGDAGSITEHGFVWGKYDLLTLTNSEKVFIEDAPELDQYSMNVSSSLEAMKEYFVRSYIKTGQLVVYGDPVKFISLGSMAPEITDFEPKSATWGDTVTIYGKNLTFQQTNVRVHFGTILAPAIKSSNVEITVKVPDQLNTVHSVISLNILGNQTAASGNFTLLTFGKVESVTPAAAKWGDTLIIKGVFPYKEHTIAIRINNISTTILDLQEDQITALFPPSNYAPSVEIQLGVDLHWLATGVFVNMISPDISSVSPSGFGWEDTIVIKGNFDPVAANNQVFFDDKTAVILKADHSSITCIVPLLETHSPKLTVKSGAYTYPYAPQIDLKGPEIISITPDKAGSNEKITINGKYFSPWNTNIAFNNINNLYNYQSSTTRQIVAYLAGNITANGPVAVRVTVLNKSASSSNLLAIANPAILSVTPEFSFYGDIVTISGEYFDPDNVQIYMCSENDAVIVSATPDEIKFRMPDMVGCIVNRIGLIISGNLLTYNGTLGISPPVVNSINPSNGNPGDIIELTGDFFNPVPENNKVYFDGNVYVTPIDGDRYHLHVKVPSLISGNYNLRVNTSGSVADAGVFQCNSAWTSYSQLNTWQYDQATVINDNKMYLFGGTTGNYQFFQQFNFADARVSTFDYDNNTSHFLNSVAFILGDNAYLGIGNWDNLFNYTKSFYKFSFSSIKWTQLKDFPGSLRANSFFFSSGSYGYLGTGTAYNGELNDLWQYDPSNDSWTQKSDFPGGATAGATAVMHNGSAYVIDKNNIWLYDPALDHWIKKANFPGQARFNGVGIDDANGIYYGLGSEKMDLTWEFPTCYSDFWYYSIESDTWNKLPDFPGNRTSAYGFSYNGKIYVGGGGNSLQTFRDIIEFNPDF